jgi:serine/threonine-protein kinase HipA
MAKSLWGKVYFKDTYAGRLQEEPGERYIFTYDESYLENKHQQISYSLPLRKKPFISENTLHPFFDNLVAEGWLAKAQAKSLGVNTGNRFALLLGFGEDLAGAVSIVDPEPIHPQHLQNLDEVTSAALSVRASLSGIQRKLLLRKEGPHYRLVRPGELSTHIAKLASGNLNQLLEIEHLSTLAIRVLLPEDSIVATEITEIAEIKEQALIIPRFDRTPSGKRSYHFEEFNQLLERAAGDDKYNGCYEDMARFIKITPGCVPFEIIRLFKRILACLLIGNTDAHFKNFAMLHTRDGLRLTPAYDLVAAALYPAFQSIALSLGGVKDLQIGALKPKHILTLGSGFGLSNDEIIYYGIEELGKNLTQSLESILNTPIGSLSIRKKLTQKMETRWKGSFISIGKLLSKKQSKGGKSKS